MHFGLNSNFAIAHLGFLHIKKYLYVDRALKFLLNGSSSENQFQQLLFQLPLPTGFEPVLLCIGLTSFVPIYFGLELPEY